MKFVGATLREAATIHDLPSSFLFYFGEIPIDLIQNLYRVRIVHI